MSAVHTPPVSECPSGYGHTWAADYSRPLVTDTLGGQTFTGWVCHRCGARVEVTGPQRHGMNKPQPPGGESSSPRFVELGRVTVDRHHSARGVVCTRCYEGESWASAWPPASLPDAAPGDLLPLQVAHRLARAFGQRHTCSSEALARTAQVRAGRSTI